jgi:hypothetical protein
MVKDLFQIKRTIENNSYTYEQNKYVGNEFKILLDFFRLFHDLCFTSGSQG